jgi:excisionase family DNA binding protein
MTANRPRVDRGEEAGTTRYEIRVREAGQAAESPVAVLPEEGLLPWVLSVVGPGAMRDFILHHLPEERLTTQQAADLLGMSRPSLIKLLESGAIEYTMVGNRRSVALQSLEDYRARTAPPVPPTHQPDGIIDEQLRALQRMAEDEGDFA